MPDLKALVPRAEPAALQIARQDPHQHPGHELVASRSERHPLDGENHPQRHHHHPLAGRPEFAGSQPRLQGIVDQAQKERSLQTLGEPLVDALLRIALAVAGHQAPVLQANLDPVLRTPVGRRRSIGQRIEAEHLGAQLLQGLAVVALIQDGAAAGLFSQHHQTRLIVRASTRFERGDAAGSHAGVPGAAGGADLQPTSLQGIEGHAIGGGVPGERPEGAF